MIFRRQGPRIPHAPGHGAYAGFSWCNQAQMFSLSYFHFFLRFDANPNPQHHDAVTGTEKQNVAEDYRLKLLLVYSYHDSNVSCILEMKKINFDFSQRACWFGMLILDNININIDFSQRLLIWKLIFEMLILEKKNINIDFSQRLSRATGRCHSESIEKVWIFPFQ